MHFSKLKFLYSLIFILSYVGFIKAQTYSINTENSMPFEDISSNSSTLSLSLSALSAQNINFPFPIHLYDSTFTQARISKHGGIFFNAFPSDDLQESWNTALPAYNNAGKYYYALFPLWDENYSSGTSIKYLTTGTAPNRRFIIQWDSIQIHGNQGKYQVVFYENRADFAFVYNGTINSSADSATIGIQYGNNQIIEYTYNNSASYVPNAITFTKIGAPNIYISAYAMQTNVQRKGEIYIDNGYVIRQPPTPIGMDTLSVGLPFKFKYWESWYDSIYIKNGVIHFINAEGIIENKLSVFELNQSEHLIQGGDFKVMTHTINGEEAVIISWENIQNVCDTIGSFTCVDRPTVSGDYTFQAQLYKSGLIKLVYHDLYGDVTATSNSISYGKSAKIADPGNGSMLNNNPFVQVDGNATANYVFVVTLYKPNLQAINMPLCDSNGVGQLHISPFTSDIPTTLEKDNTTLVSSVGGSIIDITLTGNYNVYATGEVYSSDHYSLLSQAVPSFSAYQFYKPSISATRSIDIHQYPSSSIFSVDLGLTTCTGTPQTLSIQDAYTYPSYLWDTGDITNSISSNSTTSHTVTITEHHRHCREVRTRPASIIATPVLVLSEVIFAPTSLSISSMPLDSLLIYISGGLYINNPNYRISYSGSYVSGDSLLISQMPNTGNYSIDIAIYNTLDSCLVATGSGIVEVMPTGVISGLNPSYCQLNGNAATATISRNTAYAFIPNQLLANYTSNGQNRYLYVYKNEILITVHNHATNTLETLNTVPGGGIDSAVAAVTANINNYPNGFTIYMYYYDRVVTRNGTSSTASILETRRILISTDSFSVSVGVGGSGEFIRTNLTFHSSNTIHLCEQSEWTMLEINSPAFSSSNRGWVYIYLGNTQIDSIQPTLDKRVFFNAALLDNDNVDNTYKLIYRIGSQLCGANATDSLYVFITETVTPSFTYQTPICTNSEPITLVGNSGSIVTASQFSINGHIISNNIFDVSNIPNSTQISGQHTVEYYIRDINGCDNRSTQIINVIPAPIPTIASNKNSFCADYENDEIRLTLFPIGGGYTNFTLSEKSLQYGTRNVTLQNTTLPSATHYLINPDLLINGQTDTIIYIYSVSNAEGCTDTISKEIIIHNPISIAHYPLPATLCISNNAINLDLEPVGTTVTSSVTNGNLNSSNKTYTPLNNVSNETLTFRYTDPTTTCKSITTRTVNVNGNAMPPSITTSLPSIICANSTDSFLVGGVNPGGVAQFICSNPNAIGNALSIAGGNQVYFNPSALNSGESSVTVTYNVESGGCNSYVTTTATITQPAISPLLIYKGNTPYYNTTLCEDDSATINYNPALHIGFSNSTISAIGTYTQIAFDTITKEFKPWLIADFTERINEHYFQMSYNDPNGCENIVRCTLNVLSNPKPSILGLNTTYCLPTSGIHPTISINAAPAQGYFYNYTTTATNSTPTLYKLAYNPANLPLGNFPPLNTSQDFITTPNTMNYLKTSNNNPNIVEFHPQFAASNMIVYETKNATGCVNADTILVEVNPTPVLNIIDPGAICQSERFVPLQATLNGNPIAFPDVQFSTYNPNRIINHTTFVINEHALLQDEIFALYAPVGSCIAKDTLSFSVLEAPVPQIQGLSSVYCMGSAAHQIIGTNTATNSAGGIVTGTFYAHQANVVQQIDNTTATFTPSNIQTRDSIFYAVTGNNGCSDTVGVNIVLDAGNVYTLNISTPHSCTNSPVFSINTSQIGDIEIFNNNYSATYNTNFITINPNSLAAGVYYVLYTYTPTNPNACSIVLSDSFTIYEAPILDLQVDNQCNSTSGIAIVEPIITFASGNNVPINLPIWTNNNQSIVGTTLALSTANPGSQAISLKVETTMGCSHEIHRQVAIYNKPKVKLRSIGGCEGDDTEFNIEITGLTSIDNLTALRWTYGDNITETITNVPPTTDTIRITHIHNYATYGNYNVMLEIINHGVCIDTTTTRLSISSKYTVMPNSPYFNDFEDNNGLAPWLFSLTASGDSIWKNDVANKNFLRTAPNNKVWLTHPDTLVSERTGSWIYSPCFNIDSLDRPMIKFDLATHLENYQGVVIQYYDIQNQHWKNLGYSNNGINWYNNNSLGNIYMHDADQRYPEEGVYQGWSGTIGTAAGTNHNPYTQFSNVRYRLDRLPNRDKLRFRIAFISSYDPSPIAKEGLMFDNFFIGNRSKKVLAEYSSNSSASTEASSNYVKTLIYNQYNIQDVVHVQYHQGDNIANTFTNPHNHLFTKLSATVQVGGVNLNRHRKFDYPDSTHQNFTLLQKHLDEEMLADAVLRFNYYRKTIDRNNRKVYIDFQLQALKDIQIPNDKYLWHYTMLLQDSLSWQTNGRRYWHMGVLRDLMVNRALNKRVGTPITEDILMPQGSIYNFSDTFNLSESQELLDAIFTTNSLLNTTTFVIIGDDKVLQVEQSHDLNIANLHPNPLVSIEELADLHEKGKEIFYVNLYPNPATDYTNLAFEKPLEQDYIYEIFDMQGRRTLHGYISQGTENIQIDTETLHTGTYVIRIQDKVNTVQALRKLVIIRP